MTTLQEIFPALLKHEGEFSTDRKDGGNWTSGKVGVGKFKGTKYGISAAAYPKLDIYNLAESDALAIYQRDYWNVIRADNLPGNLRYSVFDMAVNAGPTAAIRVLQRAAGVTADGKLGPKTLAAALTVTPMDYARERLLFYADITRDSAVKRRYLRNWISRTIDVLSASLAVA